MKNHKYMIYIRKIPFLSVKILNCIAVYISFCIPENELHMTEIC